MTPRWSAAVRRLVSTLSLWVYSALPWKRLGPHLALLVVLAAMSGLLLRGYRDDSPTEDEYTHLVRGIAYWQQSDARLSYAHPPLGNALAALPVAFDSDNPRIDKLSGWKTATASTVSVAYLKQDYGRAREQLMRARPAVMALALVLAVYVFYWSWSVFSLRAAFASLLLVAFNPVVLGQARYVTTDLPAAFGIVLATGELIRYLCGGRFSLLTMPLALSVALLMKYSGLSLLPPLVLVTVAAAVLGRGRFAGKRLRRRLGLMALHGVAAGAVILLSLNAAYRFDNTFLSAKAIQDRPEPRYWVSSRYKYQLIEKLTPIPMLPDGAIIPVPYTYLFGIAGIRGHTKAGFKSYFWGDQIQKAPAIYFPTILAIKTPPALLVFLGLGVVLVVLRRRLSLPSAVLLVCAGSLLGIGMRSNLAMGIRHVLPVVVLVTLLAGRAFDVGWRYRPFRFWRPALGSALGTVVLSALTISPYYLSYFNFLIGGPSGGHEISIYGEDWGQDRARFAEFAKKYHLKPLYYHEQTRTRAMEARHLGLRYRPLRCSSKVEGAWVAIHALSVRTRGSRSCYRFLDELEPVHKINHHVYIYWVPPR